MLDVKWKLYSLHFDCWNHNRTRVNILIHAKTGLAPVPTVWFLFLFWFLLWIDVVTQFGFALFSEKKNYFTLVFTLLLEYIWLHSSFLNIYSKYLLFLKHLTYLSAFEYVPCIYIFHEYIHVSEHPKKDLHFSTSSFLFIYCLLNHFQRFITLKEWLRRQASVGWLIECGLTTLLTIRSFLIFVSPKLMHWVGLHEYTPRTWLQPPYW